MLSEAAEADLMEEGVEDECVSLCDLTERNAAIDSVNVEHEQVEVENSLFLFHFEFVVYFIKKLMKF